MDFWKIHLKAALSFLSFRFGTLSIPRRKLSRRFAGILPRLEKKKKKEKRGEKILLILVYDRISKMPSSNLLSVKSYRYCPRYLSMAMSIKLPLPGAPFSNITRDHYLYSCVKDKEGKNLLSSKNQFCQRAPPPPLSSQDSISFPFQRRRFKVFQINISPLYPNVLPPTNI